MGLFAPRFGGVLDFQQTPDLRRSPEISGDPRFVGSSSAIFRSPNLASVVFPKIGEVGGAPTIKDSAILRSPKLDCRNFLRYQKGDEISSSYSPSCGPSAPSGGGVVSLPSCGAGGDCGGSVGGWGRLLIRYSA